MQSSSAVEHPAVIDTKDSPAAEAQRSSVPEDFRNAVSMGCQAMNRSAETDAVAAKLWAFVAGNKEDLLNITDGEWAEFLGTSPMYCRRFKKAVVEQLFPSG